VNAKRIDSAWELERFHATLAALHLAPLWESMRNLAPVAPRPQAVPALWKSRELNEQLLAAVRLITAEKAERRVIVLENPAMPGQCAATPSLYAGVQILAGGERARSHRHTASALRMVLEGTGGYTSVGGERVRMRPGDFIITPSWEFHDHGNDGVEPVTWLDGLDVLIVNLLGAPFGESFPSIEQPVVRPEGDALARYGGGVQPLGYASNRLSSPIFLYPYERTRAALDAMARHGPCDPALGLKVIYTDPTTGQSPIRTMSAGMQLLPRGFCGDDYRATDGAVFCVIDGRGRVHVGDHVWEVGRHDVFVIPSWNWHAFEASEELLIFSFSDRVLQSHLGFFREERRSRSSS
jgi:gentisate 1,2-dioxygenase